MLPAVTISSAGREDRLRLACTEVARRGGMLDVVEPGRPAADLAVGNLHDAQVRHGSEQRPGRRADPLRVREVTRVVVGDLQRLAHSGRRHETEVVEKLGDVAHPRRKTAPLPFLGASAEHVAVFLHRRAAPSCVGDDRIHILWKGVEQR